VIPRAIADRLAAHPAALALVTAQFAANDPASPTFAGTPPAPLPAPPPPPPPPPPPAGPGAELVRLLGRFGVKACGVCASRAGQMDAWGPDGCAANAGTIVGWLREGAAARKLPFVELAARLLVRRAVANARRRRRRQGAGGK
jgi:hypothetical protein